MALKLIVLFKLCLPKLRKVSLKIALSFHVLKEFHNFHSVHRFNI